VRGTEQVRLAEAEGKLLRLPTGDGGALVFRNNLEAPVLCALEIAKALKSHPEIHVRMGVHSGPVNEVTDLNEQANIAGAGINMAQRVMDCGDAGHILLSKRVADDLEHYPRWKSYLHDLGECEVKHGHKVSLVNESNLRLETAYANRDGALPRLFIIPFFMDYRDDPRFAANLGSKICRPNHSIARRSGRSTGPSLRGAVVDLIL
jgi:hypothetical protein